MTKNHLNSHTSLTPKNSILVFILFIVTPVPLGGPDYVLITGGDSFKSMVSQYNVQGWKKDLPQLQQGRYQHACCHFTNVNNDMVLRLNF